MMFSFIGRRWAVMVLWAAAILFSSSSCEQIDGDFDVFLESQNVGYEAGSQKLHVQASGKWILTLIFPEEGGWARIDVSSGSGSKDVVFSYDENTGEARTARIVLSVKGQDAVRDFVQAGKDASGPSDVPDWLELPAIENGLDYYNHSFDKNGKAYRNYSFAWDKKNTLALWVAYPLNKFYTTKVTDRTDEWEYDPKVPRNEQADMYKGVGGVYDRGHQLPSADRLCTREANEQTFYFTNMTPQLGQRFNQKIWASLEGKVRSYSDASDTLYVVTGCTVDDSIGKHTNKNDGKSLTVPGSYFKVLLRYRKDNNTGAHGYMGAAFYLKHRNYSEDNVTSSMMMSVDELEEIVGMDFFPRLANRIGASEAARVEAQDPHEEAFWGFKN